MTQNKIAIVTGGASGLGLAISKVLAQSNIQVIIFDKNQAALQELEAHFEVYCLDVTSSKDVCKAVESVVCKHKKIDILINNAGFIFSKPLINLLDRERPVHCYEDFKKVIEINLNSVFLMGSVVARKMIEARNSGVIINISSICSQGNAGQSAYSAAKAGVDALTKTWAKELGSFSIRVVSISPGFIETNSTLSALDQHYVNAIKQRIALKKLGDPQSVAQLVLATLKNEYINGTVLNIDGGCSL